MSSECLSADSCKSWEKSGKGAFIRQCGHMVGDSAHLVDKIDGKDIKQALYELCWFGLRGSLKVDQVVTALTEIMELHPELPSLLGDVLGVLGTG